MNDTVNGKYATHNARTDNKGEAEIVNLWLNFEISTQALQYLKA